MDYPDNEIPPSISTIRPQPPPLSGRRSLPANVLGPHESLPSYPSSTIHYYYPSPQNIANYAHTSTFPPSFPSHSHDLGHFGQMPLPSASQSHIPSLRRTPSVTHSEHIDNQRVPNSPFLDQRLHNHSRNSQRIHSLSPIAFTQPQFVPSTLDRQSVPTFAAPQPVPLPARPILSPPHPIFPSLSQNQTNHTPHVLPDTLCMLLYIILFLLLQLCIPLPILLYLLLKISLFLLANKTGGLGIRLSAHLS
jgi:hypothetical protein